MISFGNRALAAAEQWAAGYAKAQKLSPVIEIRLVRAFAEGVSWHLQETIKTKRPKNKRKARKRA